jgi:hypothetical protein
VKFCIIFCFLVNFFTQFREILILFTILSDFFQELFIISNLTTPNEATRFNIALIFTFASLEESFRSQHSRPARRGKT